MKKIIIYLSAIILTILVLAPSTYAETIELTVTENGSGSDNQVTTEVETTSQVDQQNTANVDTEVQASADTGDNQVKNITEGEVKVNTGDSQTQVVVVNEDINSNSANMSCCINGVGSEISGNGSNSTNSVNMSVNSSTNINQTNVANITNNITVNADTGGNKAEDNNGNVSIETGNIRSKVTINNKNINQSVNHSSENNYSSLMVKVNGNGSGSNNSVWLKIEDDTDVSVNHIYNIQNVVLSELETGNNQASDNLGDTFINTGDIESEVIIGNSGNNSYSDIDCCDVGGPDDPIVPNDPGDKDDDKEPATPPTKGGTDDGSGGGSDSSGNGSSDTGGNILGLANGKMLPATGSNWMLLATIANVIMFLMGLYLRLRSGRSPAPVYVV